MPSIFALEEELVQIAEAFDALEGQDETPEVLAAVEAYFGRLLDDRDRKVDGYCRLIAEYSLKAKARKAEADRIAALAKADESAADRLKSRLKAFMEEAGMTRLEGAFHKVAIQVNGGAVPIKIDEHVDPKTLYEGGEGFARIEYVVDGDAVRKRLQQIESDVEECVYVFRTEAAAEYGSDLSEGDRERLATRVAAFEEKVRAEIGLPFARLGRRGTHVRIR